MFHDAKLTCLLNSKRRDLHSCVFRINVVSFLHQPQRFDAGCSSVMKLAVGNIFTLEVWQSLFQLMEDIRRRHPQHSPKLPEIV